MDGEDDEVSGKFGWMGLGWVVVLEDVLVLLDNT